MTASISPRAGIAALAVLLLATAYGCGTDQPPGQQTVDVPQWTGLPDGGASSGATSSGGTSDAGTSGGGVSDGGAAGGEEAQGKASGETGVFEVGFLDAAGMVEKDAVDHGGLLRVGSGHDRWNGLCRLPKDEAISVDRGRISRDDPFHVEN